MSARAKQSWFRRVALAGAILASAVLTLGAMPGPAAAQYYGYPYYPNYPYYAGYPYYPYYYGYPYWGWGWGLVGRWLGLGTRLGLGRTWLGLGPRRLGACWLGRRSRRMGWRPWRLGRWRPRRWWPQITRSRPRIAEMGGPQAASR
jgi:hypothetical protein